METEDLIAKMEGELAVVREAAKRFTTETNGRRQTNGRRHLSAETRKRMSEAAKRRHREKQAA